MRKLKSGKGFTLAELLIVVAIIGALSGVAFVAVQNHQKSMTQLERDAVAKEIFVAAQNHLTLAKGQNYNTDTVDYTSAFFGSAATGYTVKEDVTGNDGKTVAQEKTVDGICYVTNASFTANNANIIDMMLPFGSIDETIRAGHYMILYQPKAGVVLDVFYWDTDGRFGGSDPAYSVLLPLRGDDKKSDRRDNKPMLGWFGGEGIVDTGEFLETPSVEVVNAERLLVRVTDPNVSSANQNIKALNPMLKLIIEGETSKARAAILLTDTNNGSAALAQPEETFLTRLYKVEYNSTNTQVTYTIVLDDITKDGLHFAQLKKPQSNGSVGDNFLPRNYSWDETKGDFIPGENITVQAVAYSNSALTSVAYSGEWTTNSLFGELRKDTDASNNTNNTALISNIRHLENLDDSISNVAYNGDLFNGKISAEQTRDLIWKDSDDETEDFVSRIATSPVNVYTCAGEVTKDDCFMPVSPSYALTYNGQNEMIIETTDASGTTTKTETTTHSITGIVVDNTTEKAVEGTETTPTETATASTAKSASVTAGGLFGTLTNGTVRNLELRDFSVALEAEDKADAVAPVGALAGNLTGCTVENVAAYNSTDATAVNISTTKGSAGGLVGSMSNTAVSKSAAALIVSSASSNAGGLVGTSAGGTVSGCYSGGHTVDGQYEGTVNATSNQPEKYNVTATVGTAGGLIGDAGNTNIEYSYSTCSAAGAIAGGFVGTSTGKLTSCYATGLVRGTDTEKIKIDDVETEISKDGAFAYSVSGTAADVSGCKYFEIVNERKDATTGVYSYLAPLGKNVTPVPAAGKTEASIEAFDATAVSYNAFVPAPADWAEAIVYDKALENYYKVSTTTTDADNEEITTDTAGYPLKTVAQLGATVQTGAENDDEDDETDGTTIPADFVASHYGDWPAPEIFVENTKTATGSTGG